MDRALSVPMGRNGDRFAARRGLVYVRASGEELLKRFQDQLKFSINNINPIALFDYVGEFGVRTWRPVQEVFDAFFSAVGGVIDWVLSLFQDRVSPAVSALLRLALSIVLLPVILIVALVMVAGALGMLGLAVLLSPIIVTLAVVRSGNLIEAALVLLIFLPLMWLVARTLAGTTAADLNMRERVGVFWLGTGSRSASRRCSMPS
jgi:hypothetical protein